MDERVELLISELRSSLEASSETLLTGPVEDQAALHGFLSKVRDLS
jgi:hypothetical protein